MLFENKCRRAKIFLSILMITFSLNIKTNEAARDRGARCEKPDYIPNGSYRIRRDRLMRIMCNSGFVLQGSKTIDCIRGKWDGEKPVCAKKGCKRELEQPENGRIQIENGLKAILYCSDNYNLAGNRHSYCNGSHWDRPIGNCRERKNVVQHKCDFETDDICGWTYEPREGLEWKRVMAANVFTTFKTGPRHDHTTLTANGGHYMLMESLTKQNDYVTLTSPIYDRALSLKTACCFQFYYFMYGAGVGDLFVVVKPVSLDLDDVLKAHKDLVKFQKNGNQNNIWNEAHFNIEEFDEDFQILFIAKSGSGQLSDIAIDDVKLLTGDECRVLSNKEDEDLSSEEYEATTYESIFEIQSCAGRCFESPGSGIIRTFGHLKGLCNCDIDCEDNDTCCPDFRTVCSNEIFAQSTPVSEADDGTKTNDTSKNYTTSTQRTTIISISTKTTPKSTTTTMRTAPTTTTTTQTTPKTTATTVRTTPKTTIKTTLSTTTSTTPTPSSAKPTKTTTIRLTTTTTRKTSPKTTTTSTTIPTTTTVRRTTPTTTTTRKTTPTTTTPRKTTPTTTTTRKATPTTTTIRKTTPTTTTAHKTTPTTTTPKTTTTTTQIVTKTTKFTKATTITTQATLPIARITQDVVTTTTTRKPVPTSGSIEYVINKKSEIAAANKGSSRLLVYIFFIIIAVIIAGAAYKRFGHKAVTWYMIRFKQNTTEDEDSSSITTSFKQPHMKASGSSKLRKFIDGASKTTWRNKFRISTNNANNNMTTPLVNDDDENDDDEITMNGNIALKNNIYTEL